MSGQSFHLLLAFFMGGLFLLATTLSASEHEPIRLTSQVQAVQKTGSLTPGAAQNWDLVSTTNRIVRLKLSQTGWMDIELHLLETKPLVARSALQGGVEKELFVMLPANVSRSIGLVVPEVPGGPAEMHYVLGIDSLPSTDLNITQSMISQRLWEEHSPSTSEAAWEEVVSLSQKTSAVRSRLEAMARLGESRFKAGDLDGSLRWMTQALDLATCSHETLASSERAVWLSQLYGQIALVLVRERDFIRAEACYERAFESVKDHPDPYWSAFVLNEHGLMCYYQRRPRAGLQFLARAYVATPKGGLLDATINLNSALVYGMVNEPEEALRCLQKAEELYLALNRPLERAKVLLQKGWMRFLTDRRREGETTRMQLEIREAVTLFKQFKRPDHQAGALDRLGSVLRFSGRYDEAVSSYQQALLLAKQSGRKEWLSMIHLNLAQTFLAQGRLEKAFDQAQAAKRLAVGTTPLREQAELEHTFAQIYHAMGDHQAAEAAYQSGLNTFIAQFNQVQGGLTSQTLQTTVKPYFESYINFLLKDSEAPDRDQRALAVLETYRLSAWRLGLNTGRREMMGQTGAVAAERLRDIDQHLNQSDSNGSDLERRRLIFEQDHLLSSASGTPIAPPSHVVSVLEMEHLRQASTKDQDVLVYNLNDTSSWVWLVTRDKIQAYPIPNRRVIDGRVADLRRLLVSEASQWDMPPYRFQWRQINQRLFQDLIPPGVWEQLNQRRLAIIADGSLNLLPWPALIAPNGRYLLEDKEISLAVSLTLNAWNTSREVLPQKSALVFANAVYSPPPGALVGNVPLLQPLPNSLREAESLEALLVGPVTLLQGVNASRQRFLEIADFSKFGLVHLAVHAVSHSRYPELGGLAMSQWDEHGPVPYMIRPHEIGGLNFDGVDVNLSACQTSVGRSAGDGGWGLPQSFLSVGARSVLTTLWPLQDQTGADFQVQFYKARQSQTIAAAVRTAQMAFLKDDRTVFPGYWAPYILYQ